MPVTPDQAHQFAPLVADCRPTGARRWDLAEIVAAIRKVAHLALPEVMLALTRAATDRDCNSPFAVTNMASPHWRERDVQAAQDARPIQAPLHETCSTCTQSRDEHERLWAGDHDFAPRRRAGISERGHEQLEHARAALRPDQEETDA